VGFAEERAHVLSDTPIMGLALTEALRSALAHAGLQAHDISFRVSDVTGERYGFKEMSLALSRTLRERLDELPIWCLADSIGDVGAAAGACQLVMVHEAVLRGYAPGDRAACSTAAVLGRRAVAIVGC
jgi:3-oxoacyl-[acyl-carrier-protein] synthase-1